MEELRGVVSGGTLLTFSLPLAAGFPVLRAEAFRKASICFGALFFTKNSPPRRIETMLTGILSLLRSMAFLKHCGASV